MIDDTPTVSEALAYAEGFQDALKQVESSEVAGLIQQVDALKAQLIFERALADAGFGTLLQRIDEADAVREVLPQ